MAGITFEGAVSHFPHEYDRQRKAHLRVTWNEAERIAVEARRKKLIAEWTAVVGGGRGVGYCGYLLRVADSDEVMWEDALQKGEIWDGYSIDYYEVIWRTVPKLKRRGAPAKLDEAPERRTIKPATFKVASRKQRNAERLRERIGWEKVRSLSHEANNGGLGFHFSQDWRWRNRTWWLVRLEVIMGPPEDVDAWRFGAFRDMRGRVNVFPVERETVPAERIPARCRIYPTKLVE